MSGGTSGGSVADLNRAIYTTGHLADAFGTLGSWVCAGEEASLAAVADECRDRPILDIGVGAGRTSSLLRLLSSDYVGIDYSEALVERAHKAHPDLDLRTGDARDLRSFAGRGFGLALFSYNGIDHVDRVERAAVMGQVASVLAPGGFFVFSTLNKEGPWFANPPWTVDPAPGQNPMGRFVRFCGRVVLRNGYYRRKWSSWWRLRNTVEDHGDWGVAPLSGPGSGLVMLWSTPRDARRQLGEAGFEVVCFFETDGTRLDASCSSANSPYFHVVARLG